ncbi:MAG: hypothetical protein FJ317_08510 [SAR202 cluster bacterium]|nr:hypothetical protein [SAR202 cluster bacterium]
MPAITTLKKKGNSRIWEGECPEGDCNSQFSVSAPVWNPKIEVLAAFKDVRPAGSHVHGKFWIDAHRERGGE